MGARPVGDGRAEFRVWAPRAERVALRLGNDELPLTQAEYGIYELVAPADAGDDYLFVLDGEALPDPSSRSQPHGLRGPSRVVAPSPPPPLADPPRL